MGGVGEALGMWEVRVPSKVVPCESCGDVIRLDELLFTWCPLQRALEPQILSGFSAESQRANFHAACAVRMGSCGPYAKVEHANVRRSIGLTCAQRQELNHILDAFRSAALDSLACYVDGQA